MFARPHVAGSCREGDRVSSGRMVKRDASCPEAIGKFIKAHSRRLPRGCGGMLGGDGRGRGRHLAADPQAGRGTGSLTPYGPSQQSCNRYLSQLAALRDQPRP